MKKMRLPFLVLLSLLLLTVSASANNIRISNVSVLPGSNQIQFDIAWDNSWRSDVLQNWDAAWVFFKYRDIDGTWRHIQVNSSGASISAGFVDSVSSDNVGAFIYRAAAGNGNVSLTGVRLGIAQQFALGSYDIRGYAIEMVYIPTAPFWAGDQTSTNTYASFVNPTFPALINGTGVVIADPIFGALNSAILSPFPTGFLNFYCMKYEISQGAYRDFLNSLTYLQQTARTASLPNSVVGTNALTNAGTGRPYIEIAVPGVSTGTTVAAVYGCDANGNNIFDEAGDGEWISCNYLSWPDLAAYLAWAGLCPMTELQYEKICRGPVQPVGGEYPWGTAQVTTNVYGLSNTNQSNEVLTNLSSNASEGNASYLTSNATILGPVRSGVFATATSDRISSGGSFYGVMDMAGNMWERVVTTGNVTGKNFNGSNGNGAILSLGFAGQNTWPGGPSIDGSTNAVSLMYRGGSSNFASSYMRTSDRSIVETGTANIRYIDQGGRGVRN